MVTKGRGPTTKTISCGGENANGENKQPLSSLQDTKEFLYMSDESSIDLGRESNTVDAMDEELEGQLLFLLYMCLTHQG